VLKRFFSRSFNEGDLMEVICKGRTSTGIVTVEVLDGDKRKTLLFRGTRIGLAWPTAVSPGFFTIVGQLVKKNVTGQYPLRLLREGEESIPSKLFERLTSDAGTFFCEEVYADLLNASERSRGYVAAFDAFRKEHRRQKLYLRPGPFDFAHGIFTIRGLIKEGALDIPRGTIVHEQLRTITSEDLRGQPEEKFYALNALRYVIGSFEMSDCKPRNLRGNKRNQAPPMGAFH
jgi:hypothetical protein